MQRPTPAIDDRPALDDAQFMQFLGTGVVGIACWNTSGHIHDANERFLEIVGYGRGDLEGRRLDWMSLTPREGHERERAAIDRLKALGIARAADKEFVRRDGARSFARVHSAIVPAGSNRVISIVVDVTDQRKAEDERACLMEREKLARAEAESAVRARDDILAIVSHDLRNPLSIIAMSATLLEMPLPEETRISQLGIIRRAISGMNRLIEDLLDVSQIASGLLTVDPRPMDAASLCEDAKLMVEGLLAGKSQRFECHCASAPVIVLADRARVSQVLSNLIGNANKFTPEGGRITLRVEAGVSARFSVGDTGPGISAQDLPHIFDRFWQARRVRRGGVGLGLAISKGIVEAHGGRIWAESSAGVGTSFHFTLPLADRAS
jgi:PAS domain S-box-containing protein